MPIARAWRGVCCRRGSMKCFAMTMACMALACTTLHKGSSGDSGTGDAAGDGSDGKSDDGSNDGNTPPAFACHGTMRGDGACKVPITLSHSIQNPCFSPDSTQLAVTNWI